MTTANTIGVGYRFPDRLNITSDDPDLTYPAHRPIEFSPHDEDGLHPGPPLTPELIAEIDADLCNRIDPADIAERLGVMVRVVLAVCGRIAICPPDANANGQPYTRQEAAIARTMTKNGIKASTIAGELGRTVQSVQKWRACERRRVARNTP